MSSLSFDEILLKKLTETPGTMSLVKRLANNLAINDSDVWNKYPGLPFALNIEANLNGETNVSVF